MSKSHICRVTVISVTIGCAGSAALAGALEQTNQSVQLLFEPGNYLETSVTSVSPTIDGVDVAAADTGDVAPSYTTPGFGLKMDLSEKLSFALIYDQPFGIDVAYGPSSPLFGEPKGRWTRTR